MMDFLDTKQLKFEKKENERLNAFYKNKEYKAIKLYYCFPLKEPQKYISVRYGEEETEIGIIEDIKALSQEDQKLVISELNFRYFLPEIIKIYSRKYRRHVHIFDAETTAGRKKITIINIVWNIFENPDGSIMIRDQDENYYLVKEYLKHPDKHTKFLYNYL